jgi:hypothetical protein
MLAFVIIAQLFQPLSAQAELKVGDRAVYEVSAQVNGRTQVYTKVTELVKFDPDCQRYLVRDTLQFPGRTDQVTDTWRESSDLITDERIEQILAHCRDAGGVPDTVVVPAGKFTACMLPVDADEVQPATGWIWIAKVRFGLVKEQSTANGVTSVTSLRAFY